MSQVPELSRISELIGCLKQRAVTNLKTKQRVAQSQGVAGGAPERAPEGWAEVQGSLAGASGLSLLLVDGVQPPALAVSNNNSICHALQSSPEHVQLCDPYCGAAHQRAMDAGTVTHYRCHAGLHCFAMPVQIERGRQLAVIGGRALVTGSDYRELAERFRTGDLQELLSPELFRNVIFADEADLDHAALRLAETARAFTPEPRREKSKRRVASQSDVAAPVDVEPPPPPAAASENLETELIRARAELDRRRQFADSVYRFSERIDAADPNEAYGQILGASADLLNAERGSLLLYDEATNDLGMRASRGMPQPISEMGRISLEEGIAGSVLLEGRAIVASDIATSGRKPASSDRRYKTASFISYPIRIGDRKIGVLNLADKSGGGSYDEIDLSIIESVGPQIALAVERAGWQAKASRFEVMSVTDPLTGLHNRRYLEARLFEEVSRAKRYNHAMSFMMIDIDDFKFYNDSNGHQAGDRALEITAQCLKAAVRNIDVASRYGGEEFSVLMPQTSMKEASVIADRIRRKIESTTYPHGKTQPLRAVTVSLGLSSYSMGLDSPEKIVRAADRALYHAKRQGKNRAYAYQESAGKVTRNNK